MSPVTGKTVIVTGATSGIGLESAAALTSMGANVVLVGRDQGRLERAQSLVKARSGATPATYVADFASLKSVAALADELLRDVPAIHVLLNNAGSVFARRTLTADGLESTFAVNHLSHFLLTQRLLPRLIESAPARVITVASGRHFHGSMNFDDLGFSRGYRILDAYARSKLANVLFASELAKRLAGTGVTSNSVHPGRVATNIWAGAPTWSKPIIRFWLSRSFITTEEGAAPVIALASGAEFEGVTGKYFDRFQAAAPSAVAQDAEVAQRLWEESEQLLTTLAGSR
jgi:retinol dehydrogenase-14